MGLLMAFFGFAAFFLCVGVVLALFGHRTSAMTGAVLTGIAAFEISSSYWSWSPFGSSTFGVVLGCAVGIGLYLALATPGERRAFFSTRPVPVKSLVAEELPS